ncbi:MAG: hypothetical protein KAS87_02040 [Candidatus Omnitrophica bacterium]|nr:hypothetical protein [Candidatus Omnitrophota bacterium]
MNKKGISLTEVIIATALLVLAGSGILGVIFQNTSAGQSVDYTYISFNLAKNRIERLREARNAGHYSTLNGYAETDVTLNRYGVGDPSGNFIRTTIIDPNYAANLTQITVRVNYKRRQVISPVSTEVVTLISPYF